MPPSFRVLVGLAAVMAAGCASPQNRPETAERRDVALPRDTRVVEGRVPHAATLDSLLRHHQVEPSLATSLTAAIQEADVFNLRNLKANQSFRLTRTLDGIFREFHYQIDNNKFLRVALRGRRPDGQPAFDVAVEAYPREIKIDAASVEITKERPSLFAAVAHAGENITLAVDLADVFSGEIDFNSELQRGDTASVLFERVHREGAFVGYGELKAAVLEHEGKRLVAIRFPGRDGKPGWYDAKGRSLKREFLKSPLPFDPRVTSGFSKRRLHPIHGTYRAHLGVDYAAPTGTRVVSIADGVVVSAGWSGEGGNTVAVRHPSGFESMYLHLSSFAPGIHAGARVDQGEMVGRVGMTGSATGPHLDFRIKKNGVFQNPVRARSMMPPGEPLADDAFPAFELARDRLLQELEARTSAKSN
jgi:murein DD-endopeptidase MepM/ murein hydrolase activator NlpD